MKKNSNFEVLKAHGGIYKRRKCGNAKLIMRVLGKPSLVEEYF